MWTDFASSFEAVDLKLVSMLIPPSLLAPCSGGSPGSSFICLDGVWWSNSTYLQVIVPLNISTPSPLVVNGSVAVFSSLMLSSTSIISIVGNLTLFQDSNLSLSAASDGTTNPPLNVSGCVTFSGVLSITLPSSYDLSKPYQIASHSCQFGQFTKVIVSKVSESRVGCEGGVSGVVNSGQFATLVTFNLDGCSSASKQFVAFDFVVGLLFSLHLLL